MTDLIAATHDNDLDAPLDPQDPAKVPTADADDTDGGGLARLLGRQGADALDAADIEDPERQL